MSKWIASGSIGENKEPFSHTLTTTQLVLVVKMNLKQKGTWMVEVLTLPMHTRWIVDQPLAAQGIDDAKKEAVMLVHDMLLRACRDLEA